jgi:hypothetical protein
MTLPRKYLWLNDENARLAIFFVDVYFAPDCMSTDSITLLVASRFQAKKVIRYVRARCLEFHGFRISIAWQRDLWSTGWVLKRWRPLLALRLR